MSPRFPALAAILASSPFCLPLSTLAATVQEEALLAPVMVTATGIATPDSEATYASEVHTRGDIERSGATSLVDFLARQTSLQVMPSYGNRFSPAISMRGYGLGDGYQNIVITIDGRRLNNIDMAPQLLGAIPLAEIDRIEITKGSGAIMHGDGATAGSIQIYTAARDGAAAQAYAGNGETFGSSVTAGLKQERFSLSAAIDHSAYGGFSDEDPTGHRDESRSDSWNVALSGRAADALTLSLDAASARIDTRYPGPLTKSQFEHDPAMNTGKIYTQQRLDTDSWRVGVEYAIQPGLSLGVRHGVEEKTSIYGFGAGWQSDYRYISDDVSLQYTGENTALTAGFQAFDGQRDSSDETGKKNSAWYAQGQYLFERLTLSAGARAEKVEYRHEAAGNPTLNTDEHLSAWDIGANYRFSDTLSIFGNYDSAYQAPDIDRFFSTDWASGAVSFNGFIEPAKVHTLNLGLHHTTEENRLKLTVFHSRLKDEIYLEPVSYKNTNIDRSHKYGLEAQDTWLVSQNVTARVNYAWTRALIDRENEGNGAYDGKELPGVPRHSLLLGVNVLAGAYGSLDLSHTWRSHTWAAGDFDNNNAQKQRAYHSTDLAWRLTVKSRNLELFAAVTNLFEHENGVWVGDNQIYPVDFSRTWKIGAKLAF